MEVKLRESFAGWQPHVEVESTSEATDFVRRYYPEAEAIESRHPWCDYIIVKLPGGALPTVVVDLDISCSLRRPCRKCRERFTKS